MKENNEIMNTKTKKETKTNSAFVKKVEYDFAVGDAIVLQNVTYKVVEVVENNKWHIKNVSAPFDSKIITDQDLERARNETSPEQDVNDPDLMYRPNNNISL